MAGWLAGRPAVARARARAHKSALEKLDDRRRETGKKRKEIISRENV